MMQRFLYFLLIFFFPMANTFAFSDWGKTGHQAIAEVAESRLHKKARKRIAHLLEGATLVEVSTYADEIKYTPSFRRYASWHYVNLNKGQQYKESEKAKKGDVVHAIERCILEIKKPENSSKNKAFYLKLLIHFVGDIHQPMHVGRRTDRGGNDIQMKWFGKKTNLQRLWDSDMITHYQMSFSKLVTVLPQLSNAEEKIIADAPLLTWVEESQLYANDIYADAQTNTDLGNAYHKQYSSIVKIQLLKGGIRLAKILNDLFA